MPLCAAPRLKSNLSWPHHLCCTAFVGIVHAGNDTVHAAFEVVEVEIERDVCLGDLHELVCLADPGSYRSISEVIDKDATGGCSVSRVAHAAVPYVSWGTYVSPSPPLLTTPQSEGPCATILLLPWYLSARCQLHRGAEHGCAQGNR